MEMILQVSAPTLNEPQISAGEHSSPLQTTAVRFAVTAQFFHLEKIKHTQRKVAFLRKRLKKYCQTIAFCGIIIC